MASTLFTFQSYFIIVLIILPTMIHLSTANNAYYTVCKNTLYSCGNVENVGYPFSGDNRPEFCGQDQFHLSCQNGRGPFTTAVGTTNGSESLSVRVVSINTFSHTMSLVQKPFSDESKISCQSLFLNETTINLSQPFKLSPNVANISLFFGCNTSVSNYSGTYLKFRTCEDAYYVDKAADVGNISKLCSTRRVFPVLKSELVKLNKGNATLSEVLKKGFEVEYTVDFASCLACQNSGGVCGSSGGNETTHTFVCYCSDGSQASRVCHKKGTLIYLSCPNITFASYRCCAEAWIPHVRPVHCA